MSTTALSHIAFFILLSSIPLWQVARSSELNKVTPPIKVSRAFSSEVASDLKKNVAVASQADPKASKYPFIPKGMVYYGGPVMSKGTHVYLIWYGNWPSASKTLIRDFVKQISPSNPIKSGTVSGWWTLNGLYFGPDGKFISNAISLSGEADDKYSAGKGPLSRYDVEDIVRRVISKKKWAFDNAGQYHVLISADVNATGLCTIYCGWHSIYFTGSNVTKFGLIGHSGRCPKACATSAPNGNNYLDGTISTLAQELTGTSTNPNLNAWKDYGRLENAEKCAGKFGKTNLTSTGQKYNLVGANGKKYLVQQNWNPKTGVCALYA